MAESTTIEEKSWIVFLSRKSGCLQYYADRRPLNAVAKQNSFSITEIDQCIDLLKNAQVFSTLDASSEYWHIKIDNIGVVETKFFTQNEPSRNTRRPLGLDNAVATFLKAAKRMLKFIERQFIILPIDDSAIFFSITQQRLAYTDETWKLVRDADIILILKRLCCFCESTE